MARLREGHGFVGFWPPFKDGRVGRDDVVEYVASASNGSDGGSRDGIGCKLAKSLGIPLAVKAWPGPPAGFPHARADEWARCWHG